MLFCTVLFTRHKSLNFVITHLQKNKKHSPKGIIFKDFVTLNVSFQKKQFTASGVLFSPINFRKCLRLKETFWSSLIFFSNERSWSRICTYKKNPIHKLIPQSLTPKTYNYHLWCPSRNTKKKNQLDRENYSTQFVYETLILMSPSPWSLFSPSWWRFDLTRKLSYL